MWAKLGTWAAQILLLPLLKELGMALYNFTVKALQNYFARKKKEKENQEKSDAYVNSQNPTASGDNFADLP